MLFLEPSCFWLTILLDLVLHFVYNASDCSTIIITNPLPWLMAPYLRNALPARCHKLTASILPPPFYVVCLCLIFYLKLLTLRQTVPVIVLMMVLTCKTMFSLLILLSNLQSQNSKMEVDLTIVANPIKPPTTPPLMPSTSE